jgi:hypothetical protein
MLRRLPDPGQEGSPTPVATGTRWVLWALTAVDAMVAVWMIVMGDRLGSGSLLTSIITLGGHPRVVLALALVGFVLLAATAPLTRGFAVAAPWHLVVIPIAGVVSVVALAGLLSVGGLAIVTILVVVLLFGGRPTRIDVRRRL